MRVHTTLVLARSSDCPLATQPFIQTRTRTMFGDGSEFGGDAQQQKRGAPEHFGNGATERITVPIVEVAFGYGKWWSIPQEMSAQLYEKHANGQDAG